MLAHNIDEVIAHLAEIIEQEVAAKSKLAFFPILYKKVTEAVKEGMEKKEFEDNARMEKLDVIFANRYLEAYSQFKSQENCSACWKVAFDQRFKFWPITLQHLLLGINAHINLDLGIAAAEVAGKDIEALKGDFYKINELLSSMVEGVQNDISKISPVIGILDAVAGKFDERLADFSIKIARDGAWDFSLKYANANDEEKMDLIKDRDHSIAWLGSDLAKPGFLLGLVADFIKIFERKKVAPIARVLKH